MDWLWTIAVGGVAGWLAGLVMRGRGFGLLGNIVVGIIGAVLGTIVFGVINLSLNFFWTALMGAIVLLFIAGLFRRSGNA